MFYRIEFYKNGNFRGVFKALCSIDFEGDYLDPYMSVINTFQRELKVPQWKYKVDLGCFYFTEKGFQHFESTIMEYINVIQKFCYLYHPNGIRILKLEENFEDTTYKDDFQIATHKKCKILEETYY